MGGLEYTALAVDGQGGGLGVHGSSSTDRLHQEVYTALVVHRSTTCTQYTRSAGLCVGSFHRGIHNKCAFLCNVGDDRQGVPNTQ